MNPFKWFKKLFQPDPPFKQGYDMASKALLNCLPQDEERVVEQLTRFYLGAELYDCEDDQAYYAGVQQAIKEWRAAE